MPQDSLVQRVRMKMQMGAAQRGNKSTSLGYSSDTVAMYVIDFPSSIPAMAHSKQE